MTDVSEVINKWVSAAIEAESAMLEEACEEALQSGQMGVLFVRGFRPVVTALVPFGELYEFPTRAAVDAWIERGAPDSGPASPIDAE